MKSDTYSNQLRWVMLLLATAVILPTVCLLWFMNQAVRNERLAVRQKLIDFYAAQGQRFFVEAPNSYFAGPAEHLHSYPVAEAANYFGLFAAGPDSFFRGMLIYDVQGKLLYPVIDESLETAAPPLSQTPFDPNEPFPDVSGHIDPARAAAVLRYRVLLAERYWVNKDNRLPAYLRRALTDDAIYRSAPAETIVWQLQRLINIAHLAGLSERLAAEIQSAEVRMAAYNNAFEAAYRYPSADSLTDWPDNTLQHLTTDSDLYGLKVNIAGRAVLAIASPGKIMQILAAGLHDMQDDTIAIHITDDAGSLIAGAAENSGKPFLTFPAGTYLPNFMVSVFFKDSSVFEEAARRQTSVYTWTGILAALLVVLAGSFAIRSVSHQIKMNRLRNDFIATVTHELKTPLASMRLLVDTLLEKRYDDEATAAEYLQMVANENKRLTHLIDSFLTFSRMERNKQVFDIHPVAPADIAGEAAEAMQTKLGNGDCHFTYTVADKLPPVRADKDAMVTVLINLLDNACKYTNDNKRIALKVEAQNGTVCFAVEDNGIGLSPRTQKKIFTRFYQVDSRLSRRAEGCGLGLSIVKFIVDAHKGTIDVQSRPHQGSLFTVKLPAYRG